MSESAPKGNADDNKIAIIGMSGRFPGADNTQELWRNIIDGVESVRQYTDEELLADGHTPEVIRLPEFVRGGAERADMALFDAAFFGFSPREAAMADPQIRFVLECAWEALEDAGYDTSRVKYPVGIFAGCGYTTYAYTNVMMSGAIQNSDSLMVGLVNDRDFLATRVAYKMNLRGPAVTVQSACSTSMVAAHLACETLLSGQCDMALAAASTLYRTKGYLHVQGSQMSSDGHNRTFDEGATGAVPGSAAGVVVLKRLADARADGDHIYAIILGSAINNDGLEGKVGFAAPSIQGQSRVVRECLAVANIRADTIGYVEAHGTATKIGDPIEVAGLTDAFFSHSQAKGYCALGAIKANIGHTDSAAGVVGIIKAALILHHRLIPPSVNFERPNPKIDFANSPFYVNQTLREWPQGPNPRRASASAFGMGGTNAHVILEEAPAVASGPGQDLQLVALSARTDTALEAATTRLGAHLKEHQELNLADVAFTLHVGRRAFGRRRIALCRGTQDAIRTLEVRDPKRVFMGATTEDGVPVAFMFTGQGAQYPSMAKGLYDQEPRFRATVDLCAEKLRPLLNEDIRESLFPAAEAMASAKEKLDQTFRTQPALFTVEYALAQLLMEWGVRPSVMIGHSIGEYVAACLAGVFSLDDALSLVAARGKLMQSMVPGAMTAVPLSEDEVKARLTPKLSLAAVNAPQMCVVAGPLSAVEEFEREVGRTAECRRLHTSHAFHSASADSILPAFAAEVRKVKLSAPKIPFASNVTGKAITASEATDPDYWVRHLRGTVRFADGVKILFSEPRVLLEVGPGQTLMGLASLHPDRTPAHKIIAMIRAPKDDRPDREQLLAGLGQMWCAGGRVSWEAFYAGQQRQRVSLPTYPFERQRYWMDPRATKADAEQLDAPLTKRPIGEWTYAPAWKGTAPLPIPQPTGEGTWLLFDDAEGLAAGVASLLERAKQRVFRVSAGEAFERTGDAFRINPTRADDYGKLVAEIKASARPLRILHLWNLTHELPAEDAEGMRLWPGFVSLVHLARAIGAGLGEDPISLVVASNHVQAVSGDEPLSPDKATLLGASRVIPREYPHIRCRNVDLILPATGTRFDDLAERLVAEALDSQATPSVVAYRGSRRWVEAFERVVLPKPAALPRRVRDRGVYLISGGFGGIGLVFAEYLAQAARAKIALVGRTGLPAKVEWASWLAAHPADDPSSLKIRKLQDLERAGAQISVYAGDVADPERMGQIVQSVVAEFGPINGVIHSAGVAGGGILQLAKESEILKAMRPKSAGTVALNRAVQKMPLDFFMCCSSVESVFGNAGRADYTAANIFQDAFCLREAAKGRPFVTVNWDSWTEVGMAAAVFTPEQLKHGILSAEAKDICTRILDNPSPQVVVSTIDLRARLQQIVAPRLEEAPLAESGPAHPRPNLGTPYVAPRNQDEETLAQVWASLLGVEKVGVDDDFFDLGGHSVAAIQVAARIRDVFKIDLPVRAIFTGAATVAGMTKAIAELRGKPATTQAPIPRAARKLEGASESADAEGGDKPPSSKGGK